MPTLTKDSADLVIELFCEPEDIAIEGNASATGEPEEDEKTNQWIRDELARGNDWAWCCAHVRVTYRGTLTADDYLGACSYESEKAFRAPGGYFDDMVEVCVDELNAKLTRLCAA